MPPAVTAHSRRMMVIFNTLLLQCANRRALLWQWRLTAALGTHAVCTAPIFDSGSSNGSQLFGSGVHLPKRLANKQLKSLAEHAHGWDSDKLAAAFTAQAEGMVVYSYSTAVTGRELISTAGCDGAGRCFVEVSVATECDCSSVGALEDYGLRGGVGSGSDYVLQGVCWLDVRCPMLCVDVSPEAVDEWLYPVRLSCTDGRRVAYVPKQYLCFLLYIQQTQWPTAAFSMSPCADYSSYLWWLVVANKWQYCCAPAFNSSSCNPISGQCSLCIIMARACPHWVYLVKP